MATTTGRPSPRDDRVIGLDGDDTLWHSESVFATTHERFRAMVRHYATADDLDERLLATERRNLRLFGYGVKGFALSLIETAIDLTDARISAADIARIVTWTREMLDHPVELLDGVADTVAQLSRSHRLILVTKGDLFHQESKIARSGLADHFERIDIVAEKDARTYARVLTRADIDPARFVMVGNSVRSDVLPVLEAGGHAVHIPYHVTWEHEQVTGGHPTPAFVTLPSIRALPAHLAGDRSAATGVAEAVPD